MKIGPQELLIGAVVIGLLFTGVVWKVLSGRKNHQAPDKG